MRRALTFRSITAENQKVWCCWTDYVVD